MPNVKMSTLSLIVEQSEADRENAVGNTSSKIIIGLV